MDTGSARAHPNTACTIVTNPATDPPRQWMEKLGG